MNMTLFKWLVYGLLFIQLMPMSQAIIDDEFGTKALRYGTYQLMNERRIDKTTFEYEYQATLTNITNTKLKGVSVIVTKENFLDNVSILTPQNELFFGDIEVGETKSSQNMLILRINRAINPVEIPRLGGIGYYSQAIKFDDQKNNHITIYHDIEKTLKNAYPEIAVIDTVHLELSDLMITEHQNPTNIPHIANLPFITDQFIEITFPDPIIESIPFVIKLEVEYTKNPYRVVVLKEDGLYWEIFTNNKEKNLAEFTIKVDSNNKITFALIEAY